MSVDAGTVPQVVFAESGLAELAVDQASAPVANAPVELDGAIVAQHLVDRGLSSRGALRRRWG